MVDKPTLCIDYQNDTIQGPSEIIGRFFATPKTKMWYGPPEATIATSDPQRLRQTGERLRQLAYSVVESRPPRPRGRDLITPYGGFSLAGEGARAYRLGSRFETAQSRNLSLEGERREAAGQAPLGVVNGVAWRGL